MDVPGQIARLRAEGEALAAAAERGPLDARVHACPEWDVEQLLRHIGDVHRWAATVVRERRQERLQLDFEGPAQAEELLRWYRDGHQALLEALEQASEDQSFWFWGPAPNALSFWARRQANETAVHRCDAESARGAVTPLPVDEAVDGIDEWLGLVPHRLRRSGGGGPGLRRNQGRTLHLHATDGDGEWVITLGEAVTVTEGHARADCALRGPASDLFLWSMNRRGLQGLETFGDATLLEVWTDEIRF